MKSHEKISPTAWSVAYGRTFSDVPFSREIFNELDILRQKESAKIPGGKKKRVVAVQFEARYKLINRFLKQKGYKQILEIAAGLTPRGLEFCQDRSVNFVEFDLPAIIAQKRQIIKILEKKRIITPLPNLRFVSGNALISADLEKASGNLNLSKPVSIVTEGLLRYLTFKEKKLLARNIRAVLLKAGGVWLTPDTQTQDKRTQNMRKSTAGFSQLTGRDIEKNYFRNIAEAKSFFSNLGFKVESHQFSEIQNELVILKRLQFPKKQIDLNLKTRYLFVMEPDA
ncbi:MAG: class I SAM-dependent methyltransferase [Patescibacteria group bacterium]|nr:class I SAM-dependent methyltransferase [Patescibacteria group bacterium]